MPDGKTLYDTPDAPSGRYVTLRYYNAILMTILLCVHSVMDLLRAVVASTNYVFIIAVSNSSACPSTSRLVRSRRTTVT